LAAVCFALAAARLGTLRAEGPRHLPPRRCSAEMVRVQGFCIDRWEVRTVDASTGEPLSPYYPPSPKLSAGARRLVE